ncbi:hypothetical protein SFC43_34785 [Bacteroides sp. CR5/BHMF/2]|nr:hypothetical protein [Bacteroides sp. CR5/BHMF/2]
MHIIFVEPERPGSYQKGMGIQWQETPETGKVDKLLLLFAIRELIRDFSVRRQFHQSFVGCRSNP